MLHAGHTRHVLHALCSVHTISVRVSKHADNHAQHYSSFAQTKHSLLQGIRDSATVGPVSALSRSVTHRAPNLGQGLAGTLVNRRARRFPPPVWRLPACVLSRYLNCHGARLQPGKHISSKARPSHRTPNGSTLSQNAKRHLTTARTRRLLRASHAVHAVKAVQYGLMNQMSQQSP